MKILLFTLTSIIHLAAAQNGCLPTSCDPFGPVIRFPFRLKGQPKHCGYPGFELSCSENSRTELNLQYPLTASTRNILLPLEMTVIVWDIDYEAQQMLAGGARARSCLPEKLPTSSSSASLFEAEAIGNGDGYTLFNCSNTRDYETVGCLSSRVIPFSSGYGVTSLIPYSSCFKMYNISYVPDGALTGRDDEFGTRFYLKWRRPACGSCEGEGEHCRLKIGGNGEETECFTHEQPPHGTSRKHKALIAGTTVGVVLIASIMTALFFVLTKMKTKRDNEKLVEKALSDHKTLRPKRYSYEDIETSTKHIKEKLGQESLHKGMLADGTPVAVKILNGSEQNVEDFISEVERIGRMQHTNVLQLIGYCVDGRKRALVYEFLQSGTLESVLSLEDQRHNLGWEKLHRIALGIAKGVDYVHKESKQKILNLEIHPNSILLDQNFDPKILVSTTSDVQGAAEYIAPELFSASFNIISQNADVYSFGMLCLDIVQKKRNLHGAKEISGVNFPEWFYNELKNREERAIQIEGDEQEEKEIIKKISIVGLWCIQWFPSDRPSVKAVIQMLEGDNMPVMPPNPFASTDHNTKN